MFAVSQPGDGSLAGRCRLSCLQAADDRRLLLGTQMLIAVENVNKISSGAHLNISQGGGGWTGQIFGTMASLFLKFPAYVRVDADQFGFYFFNTDILAGKPVLCWFQKVSPSR